MFFLVAKLGICEESCNISVSAPPAIPVVNLKAKGEFSEERLICSRKLVSPKGLKGSVEGCGFQVLPFPSCLGRWIVLAGIHVSFMLQSRYDLFLVLATFLSPPLTQIFFLELPVFPLSPFSFLLSMSSSDCMMTAIPSNWPHFYFWSCGTCLTDAGYYDFTVTKARARRTLGNA